MSKVHKLLIIACAMQLVNLSCACKKSHFHTSQAKAELRRVETRTYLISNCADSARYHYPELVRLADSISKERGGWKNLDTLDLKLTSQAIEISPYSTTHNYVVVFSIDGICRGYIEVKKTFDQPIERVLIPLHEVYETIGHGIYITHGFRDKNLVLKTTMVSVHE